MKFTQGAWKTVWQNRKANTLTLTCEWEFTSWHNVYKAGEIFSEDTRHREVCEMQTHTRKTYRQKRKEDTLTLTHSREFTSWHNVYKLGETFSEDTLTLREFITTWHNVGKHLQRTDSEVCERQQTRCVKDRQQTEVEGEYTNTHTCEGVYIMTQRVRTWGNICRGHTVRCVKDDRQGTWKTDRQKRRRTHSHSCARGGLHHGKTCTNRGKIFRGHMNTTQAMKQIQNLLVKQMQKQYNSRHTQTKCKT